MDVDRWRRVERVLDDALAHEEGEWPTILDECCAGDPALRREVAAMLDRLATARGFLERSPAVVAELVADARDRETAASFEGRRVGAHRIVRELGRGGMSRVYLAERADGVFEQRVALKLLRAGLDTEIDQTRFRLERQILASLAHPNIARLLDGGVAEDGLPYLVLEYVEGQPIDRYCEAHAPSIPDRLALFATVARATQYAHNSLVVHRDLKPSNIFVAADGTVKLLDFGLAKLLQPDDSRQQLATRAEHRWMTPEYAAPEQIRGEAVTTLVDVYQLGVVLYELLAGRLPFAAKTHSTRELETAILEEDPPLPSSNRPALRGDLDAIVMKALAKEPLRRYASPTALVDDLLRYREGRPVLARRASAGYRLRKYIRRNKVGVTVGAVAAIALVGGALRERSLRERAELEARKSSAVEEYLVQVFDVADPFAPPDGRGSDLTARAILDRGASRIDSVLVGQSDVQAELRQVIGRVYNNLGLFDRAAPMLRRSLAQRRALLGDRDAATAVSIDHLASVVEERNRYDAAEPLYREALATRRALFGDQDVRVAQSTNHLALMLWRRGKYDDAEPLYRQALAIEERQLGRDHPQTAQTVHNLAQTQYSRGKLDEAEALYRRALAAKRKALGDAHPSVTVNLNNLAVLLVRGRGELVESEALAREALALDRKIFGERHGYVAASLDNVATILKQKGDFAEALPLYRQALEINRALLGPEHGAVALNLNNIANTLQLTGDYAAAIPLFRQSATQYEHLVGVKHANYVTVRLNLARALRESEERAEAEQIYRTIGAAMDTSRANQRNALLQSQLGLGQILTTQAKLDQARPMLEHVLAAQRKQLGDTSWRTAEARLALGVCLAARGDRAGAEPLLRDAAALADRVKRAQPLLAQRTRTELARFQAKSTGSLAGR
ncbi:MAG: serine/threonine-protein kinase [Gemmatimonadaceae bacterium]